MSGPVDVYSVLYPRSVLCEVQLGQVYMGKLLRAAAEWLQDARRLENGPEERDVHQTAQKYPGRSTGKFPGNSPGKHLEKDINSSRKMAWEMRDTISFLESSSLTMTPRYLKLSTVFST